MRVGKTRRMEVTLSGYDRQMADIRLEVLEGILTELQWLREAVTLDISKRTDLSSQLSER